MATVEQTVRRQGPTDNNNPTPKQEQQKAEATATEKAGPEKQRRQPLAQPGPHGRRQGAGGGGTCPRFMGDPEKLRASRTRNRVITRLKLRT